MSSSLLNNICTVLSWAALVSAQDNPFTFSNPGTTVSNTGGGPTATPTGPVISVKFPGDVDNGQVLVGSLIGITSSLTTIAVGCPDGTNPDDCGFSSDATLTAGPSTLELTVSYQDDYTVEQRCNFSEGGGQCVITGPTPVETSGSTMTTTGTETSTFAADEIASEGIVITAGDTAGLNAPVSTADASSSTTASVGSPTSTTNLIPTPSSTNAARDARVLVPGSIGALLLGLVAVYL